MDKTPVHVMVINYEKLLTESQKWLHGMFAYIDEPYDPKYADGICTSSLQKADRFTLGANHLIDKQVDPEYRACFELVPQAWT
jgi:hypothetical protein